MNMLDIQQVMGPWWAVKVSGEPIFMTVPDDHECLQVEMVIMVAPAGFNKRVRCNECGRTGTIEDAAIKWDERPVTINTTGAQQ